MSSVCKIELRSQRLGDIFRAALKPKCIHGRSDDSWLPAISMVAPYIDKHIAGTDRPNDHVGKLAGRAFLFRHALVAPCLAGFLPSSAPPISKRSAWPIARISGERIFFAGKISGRRHSILDGFRPHQSEPSVSGTFEASSKFSTGRSMMSACSSDPSLNRSACVGPRYRAALGRYAVQSVGQRAYCREGCSLRIGHVWRCVRRFDFGLQTVDQLSGLAIRTDRGCSHDGTAVLRLQ
jgi:hypothetical protein